EVLGAAQLPQVVLLQTPERLLGAAGAFGAVRPYQRLELLLGVGERDGAVVALRPAAQRQQDQQGLVGQALAVARAGLQPGEGVEHVGGGHGRSFWSVAPGSNLLRPAWSKYGERVDGEFGVVDEGVKQVGAVLQLDQGVKGPVVQLLTVVRR